MCLYCLQFFTISILILTCTTYYPFDLIHVAMPVLFNSNIGMVVLGSVSTLMFMHVCVGWV